MDSDQGKLFIGGISWETTEDKLREHFGAYGEVSHAVIMRDKITSRPRGFGFVVFKDPDLLDRVLQDKHTIDGRTVEAKRAMSREEQQTTGRSANNNAGKVVSGNTGAAMRTKKIFVGGLPPTLGEEAFRQYFQQYGNVTDVVIMYDQNTHRPRGFGFISFDSEDAVDRVMHRTFHDLGGKQVEVKQALPKDANPSSGGNRSSGGNYQSYGGATNTSSYDSRVDSRYMQQQSAGGGGYPYGSSAYGAPNYPYGAGGNGYGGYGVGGYGGGATGYGNPNAPTAGYMGGPAGGYGAPGGPRGPWANQAPNGYGSSGYGGNPGYGAASSWNSSGAGGVGAAHTGQSPSAAAGYGAQGYGYGGYGGGEGAYGGYGGARSGPTGNPSNGAGEQGSGYMSSGYGGDANGTSGYPSAWRSDPSQGGPYGAAQGNGPSGGAPSYGGGYGVAGRQPQPQ